MVVNLIGVTIIPLMMILFGALWQNHAPKTINWIYGYRTFSAMKSQATWDFAHKYFGRLWLWVGITLLIFSGILVLLAGVNEDHFGIVIPVQLVLLILPVIPTEIALKRNFDAKGHPKG